MLVTSCDLFIQSVSKIDLLLRCGGGVVGLGMLSSSEFTAGPIVLVWIAESEFVLKEHNMKHILTYCFPWSESCRGWKKAACWEYSWFPLHSCEEQNRSCFWNIKLTVTKRADHKILRYIPFDPHSWDFWYTCGLRGFVVKYIVSLYQQQKGVILYIILEKNSISELKNTY